jgi:hypothetical protein
MAGKCDSMGLKLKPQKHFKPKHFLMQTEHFISPRQQLPGHKFVMIFVISQSDNWGQDI